MWSLNKHETIKSLWTSNKLSSDITFSFSECWNSQKPFCNVLVRPSLEYPHDYIQRQKICVCVLKAGQKKRPKSC